MPRPRTRSIAHRFAFPDGRARSLLNVPRNPHDRDVRVRDVNLARRNDQVSRTFVQVGLGGGYVLFAVAQCLQLREVNRLNPGANHGTTEASMAASVVFAVGVVLFVGGLNLRRTAAVAGPAFGLVAIASGLLAAGQLAVAADQARHAIPRILVLITVIGAAGYAAIAAGWWVWSRAASEQGRRRTTAASGGHWPMSRRMTQIALASGWALFALSTVVMIVTHGHAVGATVVFGLLIRVVGFGVAAIGHWQLVAVLAWISTAQAARSGLVLLGIGACIAAVAPYLAGTMPPAAVSIQAIAYLAIGVGWLVWAAAGRVTSEDAS
jgi:hypothetical protein